jgi:dynein heavy chain
MRRELTQFVQALQVYEMAAVRHGLMVVGRPFSGKSAALQTLASALTSLHAAGERGALFEPVQTQIINPKAVTMGQLYGESDAATQEWKVRLGD